MQGERTATARRARSVELVAHVVYVVHCPDTEAVGERVVLDEGEHLVGRGAYTPGNLTFADPHLSRRHARIATEADGLRITDDDSHNGTFINGRQVTSALLNDGDVLRLGSTVAVFRHAKLDRDTQQDTPGPMLGESLAMRRIRAELSRAAQHDAPILISGESGVGKELAAHHVAEYGAQARRDLIALNCANIASQLAEAELFGHREGAFTGATGARQGMFVAAEDATLFLDEIGEMPLDLQAKLLRAIATKEIRPVGMDKTRKVNVRLVAATNRDLEQEVERGRFRGDLFARLAAWTIHVPPLRERCEDVMLLARAHLVTLGNPATFTSDAAEALLLHAWPYNVRELHNVVGVAAARAQQHVIDLEDLPAPLREPILERGYPIPSEAPSASGAPPPSDLSAQSLTELLTRHRGNIAKVAETLGVSRRRVYRLLDEEGIDAEAFRTPSIEELSEQLTRAGGSIAKTAEAMGTNRKQIYRWLDKLGMDAESFRRS